MMIWVGEWPNCHPASLPCAVRFGIYVHMHLIYLRWMQSVVSMCYTQCRVPSHEQLVKGTIKEISCWSWLRHWRGVLLLIRKVCSRHETSNQWQHVNMWAISWFHVAWDLLLVCILRQQEQVLDVQVKPCSLVLKVSTIYSITCMLYTAIKQK